MTLGGLTNTSEVPPIQLLKLTDFQMCLDQNLAAADRNDDDAWWALKNAAANLERSRKAWLLSEIRAGRISPIN